MVPITEELQFLFTFAPCQFADEYSIFVGNMQTLNLKVLAQSPSIVL